MKMNEEGATFSLLTEADHATVTQRVARRRVVTSDGSVDEPLRHGRVEQAGHAGRLLRRKKLRRRIRYQVAVPRRRQRRRCRRVGPRDTELGRRRAAPVAAVDAVGRLRRRLVRHRQQLAVA